MANVIITIISQHNDPRATPVSTRDQFQPHKLYINQEKTQVLIYI